MMTTGTLSNTEHAVTIGLDRDLSLQVFYYGISGA
jgi:hypothetical protein